MKHIYALLASLLLICTQPLSASFGFVTNQDSNTVSVVNSETNQIVGTISVGQSPQAIVLNQSETKAYVANTDSNSISIIDTTSFAVIDTITSSEFNEPNSLAIDPKDRYLAVGNGGNNHLVMIELGNTPTVATTLDLGFTTSPRSMAVTPNGLVIYVPDSNSNIVAVLDMTRAPFPTRLSNITVGNSPSSIDISPSSYFAAVANKDDDTVSIISLVNNIVTKTVNVGSSPSDVAFSYDSSEIYVTNSGDNSISTLSLNISGGVEVGQKPLQVQVSPDGQTAYVNNRNSNSLSAISTTTFEVLDTIDVRLSIDQFVFNTSGSKIYAIDLNNTTLKVIDTFTHNVTDIVLADRPGGITFQDSTSLVLVTLANQGKLQVINSIDDSFMGSIFTTRSESDISFPSDVVAPPGSPLVYVLNNNPFRSLGVSIGILNPGNLQLTDELQLSNSSSNSLFMTPNGAYVCVINSGRSPFVPLIGIVHTAGTTTIIDTSTQSIIASPITGGNASRMVSTYNGDFLYSFNGSMETTNVLAYDIFLISTVGGVQTSRVGNIPSKSAKVTPDDAFLYVVGSAPDSVFSTAIQSDGKINFTNPYQISIGSPAGTGTPADIDFTQDSKLAFITNNSDASVAVIPIDPNSENPLAKIWYNTSIDILNSISVSTTATNETPGVIQPNEPIVPDTPPILPGVPTPTPEEPINTPDIPQAPQPPVCSCADAVWVVNPTNNTVTIRKKDSPTTIGVIGFSNPSDIAIMLKKEYLLHTVFTLNTIGNQWASERFASLTWSGFPGALEYKLYRNDEFLASFGPDINSYEDHNLSFDTNYTYTLYICTESGALQAYQFELVE